MPPHLRHRVVLPAATLELAGVGLQVVLPERLPAESQLLSVGTEQAMSTKHRTTYPMNHRRSDFGLSLVDDANWRP